MFYCVVAEVTLMMAAILQLRLAHLNPDKAVTWYYKQEMVPLMEA
jgi:hypothetical protein